MPKVDHLRLCNEHNIPFRDFEAQFCQRCLQPECTRSQHGKSRFDTRVMTWEDRLFTHVSRMDPSDERFKNITAQKFLLVDPGTPKAPSAWVDPKDLEPTRTISIPAPEPTHAPVVVAPVSSPAPVVPPPPTTTQLPMNTPNRPRQMVGAAEQKPTAPVLDPWQPK